MGEIKVQDKQVVVPGEELASGLDYLPSFGTYRDAESIVAGKLGLVNIDGKVIKLIPLKGRYLPKRNDVVIGRVTDVLMSGWRINVDSAYEGMLPLRDATSDFIQKGANLTRWFDIDDYLMAKITNVTSQKLVDLTMKGPGLRKLKGGRIIKVNTHKVPRVIGKSGSMVSMVKQATNTRILVGQNGLIWIESQDLKNENIAVEAIKKIEKESHISGLTDKMKAFLEEKTGNKIESPASEERNQNQE